METIYRDNPKYKRAIEMVNYDLLFSPYAIIICKSELDVQNAIRFANTNNKKIKVRGGRHSYTGASTGNQDSIVIDISKLDKIKINVDGTVKVGSGCQLYYDLYKSLWKANKTSIPAGSCPSVGIGGLATGGGYSFSGRKYGLTCDSILSLKIVLSNGNIVSASNDENQDLFWACCGAGGGNFGVITEFVFKTFSLNDVFIYNLKWDWSSLTSVGSAWFEFLLKTSPDIMPFLKIGINKTKNTPTLTSFGQSYGSLSDLSNSINSFLSIPEPSLLRIIRKNGIESIRHWAGIKEDEKKDEKLEDIFMIHNADFQFKSGGSFYADSVMIKNKLTNSQYIRIEKIVGRFQGNGFIVFDGHANGISSKMPKDTNAYAHRDALASVQIYSRWNEESNRNLSIDFVDSITEVIRENNSGAYVNYSNSKNQNWFTDYYSHNCDRLMEMKLKYDPENIFVFPQSIPLK